MRVFSKFKDYYDNIGFNTSEDRVWERHTQYFKFNFSKYPYNVKIKTEIPYNLMTDNIKKFISDAYIELPSISVFRKLVNGTAFDLASDYCIIIGFCGKLYCGIVFYNKCKHTQSVLFNVHSTYIDFNSYVDDFNKSGKTETLIFDKKNFWISSMPFNEEGIKLWTKKYQNQKNLNDLFIELNSPIFIVKPEFRTSKLSDKSKGYNFIVNPCLDDYKIQKIFDPYTAYQEIDMYLNNVLTNVENPNIVRTDELIRDSKGMDENSFKQIGPKKRKQKKS